MSIEEREQELVEEFALYPDWMGRYEHIIELGETVPKIEEKYKNEDHLVRGCQSKVWLHSELKDNRIYYTADSEALITKGLVAMVVRILSGHTPEEIVNAPLTFLEKSGLHEHLSPSRSNGLAAVIKQAKLDAVAYKSISN
jgi:cysteine desulfuration protein SufE